MTNKQKKAHKKLKKRIKAYYRLWDRLEPYLTEKAWDSIYKLEIVETYIECFLLEYTGLSLDTLKKAGFYNFHTNNFHTDKGCPIDDLYDNMYPDKVDQIPDIMNRWKDLF